MTDQEYWERHARKYDASLRVLGKPLPRMLKLTREAVSGCNKVLEVAAGTGLVTTVLAQAASSVVATDYAASMVAMLNDLVQKENLRNVTCLQADLYALDFEPGSFDAVVAANVLHLVPDFPKAVAALRRMLKADGRLVVPTFCHDETTLSWIVSRALAVTGFPGKRRFTYRSLVSSLEQAGLRIGKSELLPGLIPICYVEGSF